MRQVIEILKEYSLKDPIALAAYRMLNACPEREESAIAYCLESLFKELERQRAINLRLAMDNPIRYVCADMKVEAKE
jgi:hypothetical protein